MTIRPDVAALTDEALTLVANRGLLKRALRMTQEQPPDLTVSEERIVARFTDGAVTELPSTTPFTEASCTCGAASVCRHRIGLVLAYRATNEPPGSDDSWTPGQFADTILEARLGVAAVRRANKIRRAGYQATVVRPLGSDSAFRVELPHSTVRFLTPGEIGHAHSSASTEVASESIALAVWAVRASDESGRDDVFVSTATVVDDGRGPAAGRMLARTILVDGLSGSSAVQHASAVRTSREIQAGTTVWIADACAELIEQVEAYRSRSARHSRSRVARIIGEIHARAELGMSVDTAVSAHALGTESVGETPIRRTVLAGLGARVSRADDGVDADVYFSELDSDAVYVMRHHWSGDALTGHSVAGRRVAGTTIGALATSTIVTESAVRRANRRIRLGRRGIGRTSILPSSMESWDRSPYVIRDYAAARRKFVERRPSFARDRLATDRIGAIAIDSVLNTNYIPSEQMSTVTVADERGAEAMILVEHRSEAPGAIDAVLRAMASGPRVVAGRIGSHAGALSIEPNAVACDLGVIVPDLAAYTGALALTRTAGSSRFDAIERAVSDALDTLADISHRGVRHAGESDITALRMRSGRLHDVGMRTTGQSVAEVADRIAEHEVDEAADAWVGAVLRLMVAEESY